jgi:hypothetical protein
MILDIFMALSGFESYVFEVPCAAFVIREFKFEVQQCDSCECISPEGSQIVAGG